MTEVGQLSIAGTVDTEMIERGFARIKKAFERVKSSAKSFGSDMVRIGQATAQVGKSLGLIASVGLTAIIGLAKAAPAVAPAMAKIGVEFDRLSRVLGEQLSPFFNKFSDAFTKFVSFVDAHPDITKGFALTAGAIVGVAALTKLVVALAGAVSPTMLAALGIIGAIGVAATLGGNAVEGAAKTFESAGTNTPKEQFVEVLASQSLNLPANLATGGLLNIYGTIVAMMNELDRKGQLMNVWDAYWG